MLAMVLADFWMQNPQTWIPPLVGTAAQDIYGNTISVGSMVKMVGVVTAINLNDSHYGEIQVSPIHPGTIGPFIPDVQTGSEPQSPFYPPSNPQLTQPNV